MRKPATILLLVVSLAALGAQPARAQKKDTLLLMRQLDTMQQMIMSIQKTLDSQTAVLKTLVEQTNDNVTAMRQQVEELRKATEQNLASSSARADSSARDIQALSESVEEVKARLAKLSDQVAQTQNVIQTLQTPPAISTPGAAGAGGQAPGTNPPPVPDADTLYKSGLSSFNGGQYQLAVQSFQEFLQYYGDSDLASNAQFYIGECYYSQGDYQKAVDEYNKCIEQYPKGNKIAAAQLKKGYALLALDQQRAGIRELRSVIQRFPNAREADLARQRLKKLGVR